MQFLKLLFLQKFNDWNRTFRKVICNLGTHENIESKERRRVLWLFLYADWVNKLYDGFI